MAQDGSGQTDLHLVIRKARPVEKAITLGRTFLFTHRGVAGLERQRLRFNCLNLGRAQQVSTSRAAKLADRPNLTGIFTSSMH